MMDVLDRIAAIQNDKMSNQQKNMGLASDNTFKDNKEQIEKKENSMLDERKVVDNDEDEECVGEAHSCCIENMDDGSYTENDGDNKYIVDKEYGGDSGEDIEHTESSDDNNCDGEGKDKINKEVESASPFERNMETEDPMQFWSPGIQKKIQKKVTPKSRFQPKRNSSKQIDYSDSKKGKKTKQTLGARIMNKLKKKDETHVRKNKKLRVARRSIMEVSKMKKLRRQTRENRLRNERNMKLALQGGGYVPVRTTNVTKPKEFNFAIRDRAKEYTMKTRSTSEKPFQTGLRSGDSASQHEFRNESTKPVPFKFAHPKKLIDEKENWESMAEAAMNFQTKTPTRFRLKPSEEDKSFLEKKPKRQPHVTMPITPKLLTRGRSRRYKMEDVKSFEEKEFENMTNYKFKATEFNPKIVEMKGMYGVKNVPVPANTETKPFHFEIEERIYNRTKDTILLQEDNTSIKKPKVTSTGKLRPTQPKPFSFEEKDKERFSKKEEKIKEQILAEKKMCEFQAGLLPAFSPDPLPEVTTKKPTKVKPFNISEGSILYQTKLDLTMKVEEEEERAKRQFKARSADVVRKRPFQPITGLKPPTNIKLITLNTDVRAEERENKQYWKKQREKLAEEQQLELESEKKIAEEAEIKEFRKNAVHKANPVPNYKPLEIKKSDIPLTVPKTPNLEVKKRALARSEESRGCDDV